MRKVGKLKQQIEQGEYRVPALAVADAILRRLQELAVARADLTQARTAAGRPS
jgi:hypothetical protein